MVVGEYGGEEYGEPPTGCVGNMERIWEVESAGCGDSERKDEDKWSGYSYMFIFAQTYYINIVLACLLNNIFVHLPNRTGVETSQSIV